ncbi:MAG: alpha-ketoacid dehydrogenase subunit alpha/beta [Planctomycetota bacterium]|jgi:2-oxoisovalerate dehydrogenase E1 component
MNQSKLTPTEKALFFYKEMLRIRLFEEKILQLFKNGQLRGTTHVCIGQEAVAAGACSSLKQEDYITSNHRGHGHILARGAEAGRLMAELFGKVTGYSKGIGGSQHTAVKELNFLGSNGITGGGIPIAAGAALQIKLSEKKAVSVCFTGDGATAQGTFHESLNIAAVMNLPLLVVVENNQYAMSTPLSSTCPVSSIAARADSYNIESITIDGNDPFMVESTVETARGKIISTGRPYLIEALTTRLKGHSRSDDCAYIPSGIIADWHSIDPVTRITDILDEHNTDKELIDNIKSSINEEIENAVAFAEKSEYMKIDEYKSHLFVESKNYSQPEQNKSVEISYAEAINLALDHELSDNSEVILLGEDIAEYGGAFKITKGLFEKYGKERIINTPISENSFTGIATGAAMTGLRPVVEIMFMDFILLALDQIANHAAKFSAIYSGQYNVPLTLRTPAGGRRGYGATHSQCLESIIMKFPGIKIFCPYSIADAYFMTRAAVSDDNPVLLVEHKLLYQKMETLDLSNTYNSPEKAEILREGGDLTIISYSHMLNFALEAAEILSKQDISAEIINLRSLSPLDAETLIKSVTKTQKALIAEEGCLTGGIGAEVASLLQDGCFGYLDAPVLRVAAADLPVPVSKKLEDQILPRTSDILQSVEQLLNF